MVNTLYFLLGFYHSGGDSVRQCGQDQEWDGDNFRCKVRDFTFCFNWNILFFNKKIQECLLEMMARKSDPERITSTSKK